MNTYGGALLAVALIAGVWWLLGGDDKPQEKGKGKSKVAMVFWGLVAAWAIKNRDRFPLRWQLVGGLALAATLAFVFDVPEIAWPVLAVTLGLATVNVVRPPSKPRVQSDQLARDWPAMIEASPALAPVLKGSEVTKVEHDNIGRTVHVKLAGGRTAAEVQKLASNLDALFESRVGGVRVQADPAAAHLVRLRVVAKDPLERSIAWPGPDAGGIADPIGLGVDEHGQPVRVNLLGQHVLIAGVTGSGKSTVCEVLVRALLRMEDVEVWLVDCKPGGVEFGRFRKQAARFATEHDDVVQLLAEARDEITERGRVMSENGLQTYPVSPERRALVVVIDELAELPAEGKVIVDSIVRLGRAMRVGTVCATQRPSASALGELGGNLRSQLTVTIGLRVRTPAESRIVFGEAAQAEGWRADRLTVKGSFLLKDDDHGQPVPARCYWPGAAVGQQA